MARRLLISLGIGGLIILAAYGFIYLYTTGIFVGWEPLGAPPEGAGELVQVAIDWQEGRPWQGPAVYLAAAEGGYWRGARWLCAADGSACWEPSAELARYWDETGLIIASRCDSKYGNWLGSPPGPVVSCARYTEMMGGTHFIFESYVARLEDGSYWVWEFTPGHTPLLMLGAGILLAFVAALVAFFALPRRLWAKEKANR